MAEMKENSLHRYLIVISTNPDPHPRPLPAECNASRTDGKFQIRMELVSKKKTIL